MAATFRKILILDLDGIGTDPLELPNRARHVEGVAIAGIGIDDELCSDTVTDRGDRLRHLGSAY